MSENPNPGVPVVQDPAEVKRVETNTVTTPVEAPEPPTEKTVETVTETPEERKTETVTESPASDR